MRELDLLLVLVPFVEGEIDDPAQFEAVLVDQAKLVGDAGAGKASQLGMMPSVIPLPCPIIETSIAPIKRGAGVFMRSNPRLTM